MTNTTKHSSPSIAYHFPDLPRRPAGIARNAYLGPHWQEPEPDASDSVQPDPTVTDPGRLAAELAKGLGRSLQLSRAGALALTRLQLAIKCNDRHATMAAMDRLHALDAEMERLVERLPAPGNDDPARREWDAIARHLADQKLSLAFEKLALVSEISGPDMVSPPSSHLAPDLGPSRHSPADKAEAQPEPGEYHLTRDEPPLAEWPRLPVVQPVEWKAIPVWLIGLLMTVLAMVAVGVAVVTMTGG